jgi:hypothetical protein|tara:strand:- start:1311 stop:1631 length:321 start_codon:yes stop_codon:yes gene_type:complete
MPAPKKPSTEVVLTPQQVMRLRSSIATSLSKNIKMAQEVLNGVREWNPTQARVFTALLNKVIPDISMSYAQVDIRDKELSNMSREELEEIASGMNDIIDHEEIKKE